MKRRLQGRRPLPLPVLGAALVLVATTWQSAARADEPVRRRSYDADVYPQTGTGTRLFFAGIGATAFWYGAAIGLSYASPGVWGAKDQRLPIAGPWMAMADVRQGSGNRLRQVFRSIFLTLDGVGQAGGVLVAGEALFLPTMAGSAPGETPGTRTPNTPLEPNPSFSVTPVVSKNLTGFSLYGTF